MSGSAFRTVPATRRAACEVRVTGSIPREEAHTRPRLSRLRDSLPTAHGVRGKGLAVRTALPEVELSASWASRRRAAFAQSRCCVDRIVTMLVTRCRSRTSADLRPAARRAPADGGRTTRTRQRTGRRLSGTGVCRSEIGQHSDSRVSWSCRALPVTSHALLHFPKMR